MLKQARLFFTPVPLVLIALLSSQRVHGRFEQLPSPAITNLPLVQQATLTYQGSFRLPDGEIAGTSFGYGGTAIAFNPAQGSLFIVGHDWHQRIAEIAVPDIRTGALPTALATATLLQSFGEIPKSKLSALNPGDPNAKKIGGLLSYQGKLYASAFAYYDGGGTQVLSHFVSGLDLSTLSAVEGPYRVGKLKAGYVSGYMGVIPNAWQAALGNPAVTGQCCLAIVSRTSYGPALFTIDPTQFGVKNPVPAIPLVYYPEDHALAGWDSTGALFNGTTEVRGVVLPEGTRSVLFFGKHGSGPFCYGAGTTDEKLHGTKMPNGVGYCYDLENESKGTHAFPYAYYVWAYDALDLAAVKAGHKNPWQVRPYATWKLTMPFRGRPTQLNGAAYDPATGRIFLSQGFADGARPLIHVFTVGAAK
jgi:hypothetical protein